MKDTTTKILTYLLYLNPVSVLPARKCLSACEEENEKNMLNKINVLAFIYVKMSANLPQFERRGF